MSLNQTQINRLLQDIASLRNSDAQESRREAELVSRRNRAQEALARATSSSAKQSHSREMERLTKDLVPVQRKRADIAKKLADKTSSLTQYQQRQEREDEKARKKVVEEQRRLIRERQTHEQHLARLIDRSRVASTRPHDRAITPVIHEFFISHASEDKDGFVRELASVLRKKGANVWYDEFALQVGDSLRRSIDRGLANSRFGVVVLSESFFKKEWPQKELDGLVALEIQGSTRILPIWHKVSKDEVTRYSLLLADKVALNTSLKSVEEIADDLVGLLK